MKNPAQKFSCPYCEQQVLAQRAWGSTEGTSNLILRRHWLVRLEQIVPGLSVEKKFLCPGSRVPVDAEGNEIR